MTNWKLANSYDFAGRTVRWDTKGQGSPLILVHGTPWSSYNLRHLINGLAAHFQVYYYDLLGYGQSSKEAGDVSLGIQNEVLTQLIQYWKITNPIMVGHDFGGTTVLRTHLLNKVPCEKLILIDPVVITPWGSSFFQHVMKHESAFAGMPDYIHEAVVEAYIKTAAHQILPASTIDHIVRPWRSTKGKAAFYRQIAQADSRYTNDIQHLCAKIAIPSLILWGEEDQWIPVEKGEILHRLIPDSRLQIIPDSGHLVIEEAPDILVEAILAFVR